MFRSLARNILITGVAYSVVSLVGLLLAPFLIATYGLAGYGQILLARLFLPSATFGFLDLGIGETATRAVAAANRNGEWAQAGRTLTLLTVLAVFISAVTAVFVVAIAWRLPVWMNIAPDERSGFTQVLLLNALLQPVFFLSLVAEGVLKGFERFKRVRSAEVASALIYGGSAIALGLGGAGPNLVAAALLFALLIRFLFVAFSAAALLRRKQTRPARWDRPTRTDVLAWSRVMLFNKVLGVLQTQVAQPLIGLLIGPAAVGAFDAVVRLPRFAKAIFGLLSTTVLPLATGLKTAGDTIATARLGSYGILAALLVTVPPLAYAMAYSKALMHFWIGDAVLDFWAWQSAMFVVPLLGVPISFGGAILLADRTDSVAMNRLTMLQVLLQLILSLALVRLLEQWSFVLGQVVSVAILFPFQFALMSKALGLDRRLPLQLGALLVGCGAAAAALSLAVPDPSLLRLVAMGGGFWALAAAAAAFLLLRRDERAFLRSRAGMLLKRRSSATGSPIEREGSDASSAASRGE